MIIEPRASFLRALYFAGIASAVAPIVQAQDVPAATDDGVVEVVVTGSRIRRVDAETANPVFTLGREAIEASGYTTAGQLLQQMPNIAGAGMNPGDNAYGGTGKSEISLRGLGASRTLVLLNGVRYYAGDINALPANMIERVEVLKDGASAVYGSDAIAGVVNVITRKDFQGFDASAYYGASDKGDADSVAYQATWGSSSDKGSAMLGFNYNQQDPILQSDRSWSATPSVLRYGQTTFEGSATGPTGRYTLSRAAAIAANPALDCNNPGNVNPASVYVTRIAGTAGTSALDFKCFVGSGANNDTFNYAGETQLLTPQERYSLFGSASYELSDNISLYNNTFYTHTLSNSTIASDPFQTQAYGVPVSADSIYNPFGVGVDDLRLRLSSNGLRVREYDRDDLQFTTGLKGMLGEFAWDTSYTYANQHSKQSKNGSIYLGAITDALGPSFIAADGTPTCGTPASPIRNCTPVNFFGIPTAEQLATVSPTTVDTFDGEQHDFLANITGTLFELPAGPLGAAAGYEFREQNADFRPDFLLQNKLVDVTPEAPSKGAYRVHEFYAEVNAPLLKDLPGAYALSVSAGVRYSDYSSFGDTTNGKFGVEYRPVRDLLVRASYADIFRAPTIDDLYGGQAGDTPTVNDPCNAPAAGSGNCAGVPTGFVGERQPPATNGSNPHLGPETGYATNVGLVYNPSYYTPLSVSVDVWHYSIDDAIAAPGAQSVLDLCYREGLQQYCDLVTRNARGEILGINNTLSNIGSIDTRGVDVGIRWTLPNTDYGSFTISLDNTYLMSYDYTPVADQPGTQKKYAGEYLSTASGGLGNFARYRALASVHWNYGPFSADVSNRFISSAHMNNIDQGSAGVCNGSQDVVQTGNGPVVCKYELGSYNYTDISGSYAYEPWNTTFTLGVNNVFDKEMDRISVAQDFRTYDLIGRFVFGRVAFRFN